jgi:competence protein ComEC
MKKTIITVITALIMAALSLLFPKEESYAPAPAETLPISGNGLTIHFIDVGQADCALLECDGEYAIIDAGYPERADKVVEYMTGLGVEALDLLVATHPHGDHIGGLPTVLDAYPVETVWSSELPFSNDYTRSFQNAVALQRVPLTVPEIGDVFELGDATITVIGPVRMDYEDVNNISLVLMVQYGDIRFLFTGDMERDAEEELLDSGADVKADVLKVGHHGSYTSTSYRFLYEVEPTYAVICVGGNNEYGHPHDEPMSRLQDADVTIYRTDKMYDIVAVTDGKDIQFSWGNRFAKPWMPAA